MESAITEIVNQFGYLGICLLIAIENIFPPIPSEVILTLGGYLTIDSTMTVPGVIVASTMGSMIGATVLYAFGKFVSVEKLGSVVDGKIGSTLRLKREDIAKAAYWFNRYGGKAVFFGRFIPIVRSLISVPAGMAKMNFTKFFTLTLIGSFIWNTVLICAGRMAGEAMHLVNKAFATFSNVVGVILAFIIAISLLIFVKRRFINHKKVR